MGNKTYSTTKIMLLSVIYQNSSRIYMHGLSDFECLTSVSDIINRMSPCRMGILCDFLTIYDDLYKTYLGGIDITLNLFVALTSA